MSPTMIVVGVGHRRQPIGEVIGNIGGREEKEEKMEFHDKYVNFNSEHC